MPKAPRTITCMTWRRDDYHPDNIPGFVLTREKRRSIWLNAAVAAELVADPARVLDKARAANARHLEQSPRAREFLLAWRDLLDGPVEDILEVLTSSDPWACELRQNSPFAGVISDDRRLTVLAAFRASEGRTT